MEKTIKANFIEKKFELYDLTGKDISEEIINIEDKGNGTFIITTKQYENQTHLTSC